ncbi:hypothetical protein G5I_08008 [Acromyrmex echinatior]|uniref:Uncharacterized protein n=1 Tax=Acromyrmex echinatior TaxID=103372 RepID=F4WQB9_ACREC|nr:hypothetical protein G5I_08008 [Acromyrmex echinatior]
MGQINLRFSSELTVNIRESIVRIRTSMRGTKGICVSRVEGIREEGDFVVRAPKGSITKMIGSAIGGDSNCVNRVIITNLVAISSRPDQSEDAPPFPEQGPFLSFLVSDLILPTFECCYYVLLQHFHNSVQLLSGKKRTMYTFATRLVNLPASLPSFPVCVHLVSEFARCCSKFFECHGITSSRHVKFRVADASPSYANVTRLESYVDLALVRMGGPPSSCLAQRSPSMAVYITKEKDYCTKEVVPVLFTLPCLLRTNAPNEDEEKNIIGFSKWKRVVAHFSVRGKLDYFPSKFEVLQVFKNNLDVTLDVTHQ